MQRGMLLTHKASLQWRTQEGADGAKAPPEIPRKKIIYSFKSGAFC